MREPRELVGLIDSLFFAWCLQYELVSLCAIGFLSCSRLAVYCWWILMDSGFKRSLLCSWCCPIKEDNAEQTQSRFACLDISPHSHTQRSTESSVQAGEVIKNTARYNFLHLHTHTFGEMIHHLDIISSTWLPFQVIFSQLFLNSCVVMFPLWCYRKWSECLWLAPACLAGRITYFFLAMLNLAPRRNIQYQSLVGPHWNIFTAIGWIAMEFWDCQDLTVAWRSIVVLSWQPFNGLSWHTFMTPSGRFLRTSLYFSSSALFSVSICSYLSMSMSILLCHIFHIILYIFRLLNQQN